MKLSGIPQYQLPAVVGILILYLTLLPTPFGEESIPLFEGSDKVAHACMFGGLAIVIIFDNYRRSGPLTLGVTILISLSCSLYGIIIEILQQVMDLGRSAEYQDIIADVIGAFGAVPLGWALHWVNIIVKHRSE